MIEVMAAVSLASSAFNTLKTGIAKGKELRDMGQTLSRFWDANEQITQAGIENETSPFASKLLKGKSIEAQALEITIAKSKAAQMENDLREFLIWSGQGPFYRDMLKERRNIKDQRLKAARARAQAKKDTIDFAMLVGLCVVVVSVVVWVINVVAEK
jgi:hypothetical protein